MGANELRWYRGRGTKPRMGALMARRSVQTLVGKFVKARGNFRAVYVPRSVGTSLHEITGNRGETLRPDRFIFACAPWLPQLFRCRDDVAVTMSLRRAVAWCCEVAGAPISPLVSTVAADVVTMISALDPTASRLLSMCGQGCSRLPRIAFPCPRAAAHRIRGCQFPSHNGGLLLDDIQLRQITGWREVAVATAQALAVLRAPMGRSRSGRVIRRFFRFGRAAAKASISGNRTSDRRSSKTALAEEKKELRGRRRLKSIGRSD